MIHHFRYSKKLHNLLKKIKLSSYFMEIFLFLHSEVSLAYNLSILDHAQNQIFTYLQTSPHTWRLWARISLFRYDPWTPKSWTICDVSARTRTQSCIFDCRFWEWYIHPYYQTNCRWEGESDDLWCPDRYDVFMNTSTGTLCPPKYSK